MGTDAVAQFADFRDELFANHLLQICVHKHPACAAKAAFRASVFKNAARRHGKIAALIANLFCHRVTRAGVLHAS